LIPPRLEEALKNPFLCSKILLSHEFPESSPGMSFWAPIHPFPCVFLFEFFFLALSTLETLFSLAERWWSKQRNRNRSAARLRWLCRSKGIQDILSVPGFPKIFSATQTEQEFKNSL
jgi:hypothetical protein